jgi:hypothetical protein
MVKFLFFYMGEATEGEIMMFRTKARLNVI